MADRKCVNADLHYQNKPGFLAIELNLPLDSHVLKDHLAHEGCEQHHEYISSFLKKCISLNITIYFAQIIIIYILSSRENARFKNSAGSGWN